MQLRLKGDEEIALSLINDTGDMRIAIFLTSASLVASGVTDIYIIYDFVQNEGLVVTFVQTAFVLIIGGSHVGWMYGIGSCLSRSSAFER